MGYIPAVRGDRESIEPNFKNLYSITQSMYKMTTTQKSIPTVTKQAVRCPNCGALAERWHYPHRTQTECAVCDYLMATCPQTGNVIEAEAPGLYASKLQSVKSVLVGVN